MWLRPGILYNDSMVKSRYKLVAFLGLVACGPSWGAKPITKVDCNNNMVLTEIQPLKFGSFVATTAGSVTIDPSGLRNATGVTLVGNDGQPGIFRVSLMSGFVGDCTGYQVIITLPASYTMTSAGQTMTVNTLTTLPLSGVGVLNSPDATIAYLDIYIGGTAVVSAGQAAGLYSGSYSVSMTFR